MPEYQLQIKQVVDYPRCRIYRQFVHRLMADRSIRTSGGSGLFYFTVLCSYANFRTSYRRIDGISYTIYPGEWVCTLKEVSQWFRTRFQCQALTVLEQLQKQHFITFQTLDRGNVIRYKICDWARHNTVLEYNAPCQKDTGFFFLPVSVVTDLISTSRCSEMDIILDLWVSAVYNDNQVQGSDLGPVVYFRNGTGNPLVAYTELAVRWGVSRATVGRVLKKLAALDYISLMSFPGRHGSVVYLKNYLSTMFEVSDVMVDKEEVAMTLNIRLELPDESGSSQNTPSIEHEVIVSNELNSVSKSHIEIIIQKMAQILMAQGLIVTSNYFVAENGVTRRSRRFSVFIGCLRDDRLGNNGNIYIVHEVEENLHFLLALAAGFVRGIDDDFLDILVHDGLCQLLHIHIFLCQGDKGIQTVVHFFPLFHPFFDNFNFEL